MYFKRELYYSFNYLNFAVFTIKYLLIPILYIMLAVFLVSELHYCSFFFIPYNSVKYAYL